jgi:hypothetical protein
MRVLLGRILGYGTFEAVRICDERNGAKNGLGKSSRDNAARKEAAVPKRYEGGPIEDVFWKGCAEAEGRRADEMLVGWQNALWDDWLVG